MYLFNLFILPGSDCIVVIAIIPHGSLMPCKTSLKEVCRYIYMFNRKLAALFLEGNFKFCCIFLI